MTSIDVNNKLAVIGASNERVAYETLVLASGGTPRKLPIDGAGLENVFTLRGVHDAKKIDAGQWGFPVLDEKFLHHSAAVQEGKHLVVVGSSFISMELVAAVTKRNLASIDVIGMESVPFEVVLGTKVGQALQKVCPTWRHKFLSLYTLSAEFSWISSMNRRASSST